MAWQPAGSKGNMGEMCYFLPGKDPTQPGNASRSAGRASPRRKSPARSASRTAWATATSTATAASTSSAPAAGGSSRQRLDGKPVEVPPRQPRPGLRRHVRLRRGRRRQERHHQHVGAHVRLLVVPAEVGQDSSSCSASCSRCRRRSPSCPRTTSFSAEEAGTCTTPSTRCATSRYAGAVAAESELCSWPATMRSAAKRAEHIAGRAKGDRSTATSYAGKQGRRTTHFAADARRQVKLPDRQREGPTISCRPASKSASASPRTTDGKRSLTLVIGDRGQFSLPSQTHALHFVDINGDGLKDLVTGRRWWAHGPKGDAGPERSRLPLLVRGQEEQGRHHHLHPARGRRRFRHRHRSSPSRTSTATASPTSSSPTSAACTCSCRCARRWTRRRRRMSRSV